MEVYGVVYLIWNKVNGKRYVGQTVQTLKKRLQKHLRDDLYVDRAIRSHGIENFYCGIIKTCATKDELDEAEKHFIAVLKTKTPYGYNLTDGGCGGRHTDETRAKLSAANSGENNPMFGKKHTEETKAKIRAAQLGNKKNFGKHPSAETLAKLSAANTGKHPSAETLAKMSAAKSGENNPFFGRHHTDETRAKLSAALSGENHPLFGQHLSPEYCSKISIANRGSSPYKNLVAEIDEHHLSYSALARLMGFSSHKHVSLKMCGKIIFTERDKANLVEIFGKPIEYLLARDER